MPLYLNIMSFLKRKVWHHNMADRYAPISKSSISRNMKNSITRENALIRKERIRLNDNRLSDERRSPQSRPSLPSENKNLIKKQALRKGSESLLCISELLTPARLPSQMRHHLICPQRNIVLYPHISDRIRIQFFRM